MTETYLLRSMSVAFDVVTRLYVSSGALTALLLLMSFTRMDLWQGLLDAAIASFVVSGVLWFLTLVLKLSMPGKQELAADTDDI